MAYAQAQKLMHEYAIEEWQLRSRTADIGGVVMERKVGLDRNPVNRYKANIAGIVARANQCTSYLCAYRSRNGVDVISSIVFVGMERDIGRAVMLWQSMELYRASHWRRALTAARRQWIDCTIAMCGLDPAVESMDAWRRDAAWEFPAASWRYGFYLGFEERIRARFAELEEELEHTGAGRELVRRTGEILDAYMGRKELGALSASRLHADGDGYRAGYDAARNVALGLTETEASVGQHELCAANR